MAKMIRKKKNHKFQLNIVKEAEAWLDEWISILTKQRKFSQYVRDGLTIMIQLAEWGLSITSVLGLLEELREGRRDKEYELFPHLMQLEGQGQPTQQPKPVSQPAPDNSKEIDELKKSNEELRQMVKDLTELVTSIRINGGYISQSNEPPTAPPMTGKQLTPKQFALPVFDDDEGETELALTTKKNTSNSGVGNFMKQMGGDPMLKTKKSETTLNAAANLLGVGLSMLNEDRVKPTKKPAAQSRASV